MDTKIIQLFIGGSYPPATKKELLLDGKCQGLFIIIILESEHDGDGWWVTGGGIHLIVSIRRII